MKVFLDTNIVMDVLGGRMPFFHKSQFLLHLCEIGAHSGFAATMSFATVAYLLGKIMDKDFIPLQLIKLRSIVTPVDVTAAILDQALCSPFADFEDAMQYFCARACGADYLVTRNPQDFAPAEMAVVTPAEFLGICNVEM